jgi:hypothetical protein
MPIGEWSIENVKWSDTISFESHLYIAGKFIERLGSDAVEEYQNEMVKLGVDMFKAREKSGEIHISPYGFAQIYGDCLHNMWGSDVDMQTNRDGSITLDVKECGNIRADLFLNEWEITKIDKKERCDGCILLILLYSKDKLYRRL